MAIVLTGGTCVTKWRAQPQLTENSPPSSQHMACCYSSSYHSSKFGCRVFRKVPLRQKSRLVIKADKDNCPVSRVSENARLSEIGSDRSTKGANDLNFSRRGVMYAMISTATVMLPILPLSHEGPISHTAAFAIGEGIDSIQTSLVRREIQKVLSKFKAPSLLRLVFHDAGTFDLNEKTGGMNGSIIYELDRPENIGLSKPIKVLEKVRNEVEKVFPISWADLIAVAGSEAVLFCGGPAISVQIGRADAKLPDPPGRLPLETLDASGLKSCFLEKGFSTQELVALSGAHTLGSKGFGSPYAFDNSYFKILLEKPWASPSGMSIMIGLPSDRSLVEDDECLRWIVTYASDQVRFFDDFKSAYTKLVNCGALWKDKGAM